MGVLLANYTLSAVGVIYQANVNSSPSLTLYVDDNGGGSTITFESSTDNVTWTALSNSIYTMANGVLVALASSTTTSRGRFLVDLNGITYFRARVSNFVSGFVQTRVEESGSSPRLIVDALDTGLVATGNTQATAFPVCAVFNVFSTVAASSGALLPLWVPINSEVTIRNAGANSINVYPPIGNRINGAAVNASLVVAAGSTARFISDGQGNFWSF